MRLYFCLLPVTLFQLAFLTQDCESKKSTIIKIPNLDIMWANDGKFVVYETTKSMFRCGNWEEPDDSYSYVFGLTYIFDVETGKTQSLSESFHPRVSPNGELISVLSQGAQKIINYKNEVLHKLKETYNYQWSNDSNCIAYVTTNANGNQDLFVFNLSTKKEVTKDSKKLFDSCIKYINVVGFTQDNELIISYLQDESYYIAVADIADLSIKKTKLYGKQYFHCYLAPDKTKILLVGIDSGKSGLVQIISLKDGDNASEVKKRFRFGNEITINPKWMDNSTKIIFTDSFFKQSSCIYASDGDLNVTKLTDQGTQYILNFTTKKDKVAFIVSDEIKKRYVISSQIYIMNSDGSDLQQLTTDKSTKINLAFTPDGKSIAYLYSSRNSSGERISVIDIK
ncbi:MAG: hypothetical protein HY606_02985 [Planctomycetes bacterium]|nr:hypothetical protein [Planctomycetota bacterium]